MRGVVHGCVRGVVRLAKAVAVLVTGTRVTEAGDRRITEAGDVRVTE